MNTSQPSSGSLVRFDANGPGGNGLEEWDAIDPHGLVAGTPVQRGHTYDENPSFGYLAGVWDCTPMTENFGPYSVHEFMYLLEGSVTMIMADGTETTVNAGEAFVIPKGLNCQWKNTETVRKFFMIFEDPATPTTGNGHGKTMIVAKPTECDGLMTSEPVSDQLPIIGDAPKHRSHNFFADASGQMKCGVWETTPFQTAPVPFPRNELMCLLEGRVTLTDDDGAEHHFAAGDSVYIPKGAVVGWKCTEKVRKFYSIFDPAETGEA